MIKWQKVYSDVQEYRANIVLAVLSDAGLKPVIINKKDASYQFGNFEVHVPPEEVIMALKMIEDDIKF